MSVFENLANNISANLQDYSKGVWNKFLMQAEAELTGLSDYYITGTKNVSLLKQNLSYIKKSVDIVNGIDQETNDKGRKTFIYNNADGTANSATTRSGKPVLIDPSNDLGGKATDRDVLSIETQNRKKTTKPTQVGTAILIGLDNSAYQNNQQNNPYTSSSELIYEENENGSIPGKITDSKGLNWTKFEGLEGNSDDFDRSLSLVDKTNEWFARHNQKRNSTLINISKQFQASEAEKISDRFKTIISRFHTDKGDDHKDDIGNSAYSQYGLSHGRNLLKIEPDSPNGYDNPYCRVWTWHHQYSRYVADTIRPLAVSGSSVSMDTLYQDGSNGYGWGNFRSESEGSFDNGSKRLAIFGSMFDNNHKTNGLVNITPSWNGKYGSSDNVSIRHCMFSIENLAWKGMFDNYNDDLEAEDLSRDQKGPLGGRIMWFPPYDLSFDETSNATWNENTFIGRGEPIYTYSNTTRTGSVRFKLLIDHPAILDYWQRNNTASKDSGPDDIASDEQTLLRFFAGCDILKAGDIKTEVVKEPDPKDSKKNPEPAANPEEQVFNFLVFYPNNYSGCDDKIDGDVDPIDYLINGIGAQKYYNKNNIRIPEDYSGNTVPDNVFEGLTTKYKYNGNTVGGYEMRDNQGISIVTAHTETNAIATVTAFSVGGESKKIILMKQYDTDKRLNSPASTEGMTEAQKEEWLKSRWYYRVDKATINQVLTGDISYIDKTSYRLNSKVHSDAIDKYNLKDTTYSLSDVYYALKGDKYHVIDGLWDSDNVGKIRSVIDYGTVTSVRCIGWASSQANNDSAKVNKERNERLARERANTIQKWLQKNWKKIPNDKYKTIVSTYDKTKDNEQHDSNSFDAKIHRMALVEIRYTMSKDTDGSETTDTSLNNGTTEANMTNVPYNGNVESLTSERQKQAKANRKTKTRIVNKRYDEEGKFFKKLHENAPFIEKLISDKIKYFNPAFHSMSPEGFNARLTFLNQCMRQGPTISGSDTLSSNAANLSFGRPPVCVLRIGDFYNTKIIIDSLNITYDPLTWDLNQEGIGVMPMIASVTLGIKFIGGSDIGGPIQRLQNALSFNYYANTSVYDNRAEEINYKINGFGEVESFKPYGKNSTIFPN